MSPPLLKTKLYIPSIRSEFVARPRLIERLNQGLQRQLILVSAQAGFGKTTLISDWLRQIDLPAAWLSLEHGDNDPTRFYHYFVAALKNNLPGLSHIEANSESLSDSPLTILVNEITEVAHPFVFVLDDYHLIEAGSIHHALTFLLDQMPASMRLVIISRTDPPLPLPRLRARGQLLELRTAELRFTSEEAATFLNQVMGLGLAAAQIEALESRTEGWIAGLQLAALSMQDCVDISGFIANFTGSHRFVLDYLADEVLQQQSEPIQQFLLQTSVLNRLTGPLCQAVTGQTDSQSTLLRLEHSNLFIIPLDDERRWYRYHHLFADCLRERMQHQMGKQEIAELHRRAAGWYETNGLIAEAMHHAVLGQDIEQAAKLVEQSDQSRLKRSELATLVSWLQELPEELRRDRPRLSLFQTWALVLTGHLETVEARLQKAKGSQADIPGETDAIEATVAFFRRELPRAIELYRRAFEQLPSDNLFLKGAVTLSLATAYNLQGDLAGAGWAYAQAATISETNGNVHLALVAQWNLAQIRREQAQLHRAAEILHQGLQLAGRQAAPQAVPLMAGRLQVSLGELLYEWNNLEDASQHLSSGLELGHQSDDAATLMSAYLALTRLRQAQGDLAGASDTLQRAQMLSQQRDLTSWTVRIAAGWISLWLRQGNLAEAARWTQIGAADQLEDSAGYPADLRHIELMARVRFLLAQLSMGEGMLAEARSILASQRQVAEAAGRIAWLIEALTLETLASQLAGDFPQALVTLEKALSLAETSGYVRLFVDEGMPMARLVRKVRAQGNFEQYTDSLLSIFAAEEMRSPVVVGPDSLAQLVEPLSDRELEILILIAGGMSNRQIAEKLVLSVGTVKWHLNNVYGKLGVSSRTQAVAQARELHLID